jgi:hypothetical protein
VQGGVRKVPVSRRLRWRCAKALEEVVQVLLLLVGVLVLLVLLEIVLVLLVLVVVVLVVLLLVSADWTLRQIPTNQFSIPFSIPQGFFAL